MSACAIPAVRPVAGGSLDVQTGATSVALPLVLTVVPGPLGQPCPRCVGEPAAPAGQAAGRCEGGPRRGESCDVGRGTLGHPSLDCPPGASGRASAFTTADTALDLRTGTMSLALDAASPPAEPIGHAGKRVLCGVCADGRTPCRSDAACPDGRCGTDGAAAPNACTDGVCSPAPDGTGGVCLAGPFDGRCLPAEPVRACATDAECQAAGDRCMVRPRACFAGTGAVGERVEAKGAARPPSGSEAPVTFGGLFCVAPTAEAQTNDVFGLPGPGRILLPGVLRLEPAEGGAS